jgi:selenocysteine lyase/cysteine desulfurase
VNGEDPRRTAERLGEQGLYVWDGDYYALEPMRALGLLDAGGIVRIGFVHYHDAADVDHVLAALATLA